jgi:hypothetical protein
MRNSKMKITILGCISIFLIASLVLLPDTQAGAETMNFKLVSMYERVETVKVSDLEGVVIGVVDRKGLSIFENGDIATTTCRGSFDTKKTFQGYSALAFDDGSIIVVAWKGPTSKVPPGGKFRGYSGTFEYTKGTGRFEGIKGSGTFTAKAPNWDKDFRAKGFSYYEWTGTYTLPKK